MIQADEVAINRSKITANVTEAFGKGGEISIRGLGGMSASSHTIELLNSSIESQVRGGEGGAITLLANSGIISNNSTISSDGGIGTGGSIVLNAPTIRLNRSSIVSKAEQQGGDISFNGQTITLQDGTRVTSDISGEGFGGNISFNTETFRSNINSQGLPITGASVVEISSRSTNASPQSGHAGSISFSGAAGAASDAANLIDIQDTAISTDIVGGAQTTSPASISMTARIINLNDGASVISDTNGAASAGNITFTGTESFTMTGSSGVSSSTRSIRSTIVRVDGTVSEFMTPGTGNAGAITIGAPTLNIRGGRIVANTEAAGNAGSILLQGNALTLSNGAQVASLSSESARGNAGSVNAQLSGAFVSQGSSLSSEAHQGAGGDVSIQAGDLQMLSGTSVTAASSGLKPAGDISLTSAKNILLRNSTLATTAAEASGGDIKLTAPNLIRIVNSEIVSSVNGPIGSNGGNINIDPQVVVIQNSDILANANAGAGGNISIAALGAVLVDPNSVLDASAATGISGSVNISSPIQVLSGALVPMKLAYTQAGLSSDRCAADPKGQFSSFVQTGRDGAPQTPGGFASSPLGFLDSFQTSFLDADRTISQTARLGLSKEVGETPVTVYFFSGCRS
jgi:hypothetical protein